MHKNIQPDVAPYWILIQGGDNLVPVLHQEVVGCMLKVGEDYEKELYRQHREYEG